jgi:hypothetical protein
MVKNNKDKKNTKGNGDKQVPTTTSRDFTKVCDEIRKTLRVYSSQPLCLGGVRGPWDCAEKLKLIESHHFFVDGHDPSSLDPVELPPRCHVHGPVKPKYLETLVATSKCRTDGKTATVLDHNLSTDLDRYLINDIKRSFERRPPLRVLLEYGAGDLSHQRDMLTKFNRSAIWLFGVSREQVMSPSFPGGILACLEIFLPGHLVAVGLRNLLPKNGVTLISQIGGTHDDNDADFGAIYLFNRKCAEQLAASLCVEDGAAQQGPLPIPPADEPEEVMVPPGEELPGLVDDEDVELGRPHLPADPAPPRVYRPFVLDEGIHPEVDFDFDGGEILDMPWWIAGRYLQQRGLDFERWFYRRFSNFGIAVERKFYRLFRCCATANFDLPNVPQDTPGLVNSQIVPFEIHEWAAKRESLRGIFLMIVTMVLWFSFDANGQIVSLVAMASEAASVRVMQLLMCIHVIMMVHMMFRITRRILAVQIVWKPHHVVLRDVKDVRFATMKRVELEYSDTLYEYRRCYRFNFLGKHDFHNIVAWFYGRPHRLVASIDRIAHGFDGRTSDSNSTTARQIAVQRNAGSDAFEADPGIYAKDGIFMNTTTLSLMHWGWIKAGQPDTLN